MAGRVTVSVHVPMTVYPTLMKAVELSGEKVSAFFLAAAEERSARLFATRVPVNPQGHTGGGGATPQP